MELRKGKAMRLVKILGLALVVSVAATVVLATMVFGQEVPEKGPGDVESETKQAPGIGPRPARVYDTTLQDDVTALRAAIRKAMDLIPERLTAQGIGTITGRVTEAGTGKPVAGATIRARGQLPHELHFPPQVQVPQPDTVPQDDPEAVAKFRELLLDECANRAFSGALSGMRGSVWQATATTDEDGRYELAGLGEMDYRVTASARNVRFPGQSWAESRSWDPDEGVVAKAGTVVDFVGRGRWGVDVTVTMPEGISANDITVHWGEVPEALRGRDLSEIVAMTQTPNHSGWSVQNPRIGTKTGTILFAAIPRHPRGMQKAGHAVAEIKEGQIGEVVIAMVLAPGVVVSMTRGTQQWGSSQIDGFAVPVSDEFVLDPAKARAMKGQGARSTIHWSVQGRGRMEFPGLPTGRHLLLFFSEDLLIGHLYAVADSKRAIEVPFEIPAPARSTYSVIWVRDHEGRAITAQPSFMSAFSAGKFSAIGERGKGMREDGAYLVFNPVVPEDKRALPDARWTMTVTVSGLGSLVQEYVPSETEELVFQFKEPAYAMMEVAGFSESPGAAVTSAEETEASRAPRGKVAPVVSRSPIPGTNTFRLGPMQPGSYEFALVLTMGYNDRRVLSTTKVDIVSGVNEFKGPAMPALHRLAVDAKALPSDRKIGLEIEAETTDADGKTTTSYKRYESQKPIQNGQVEFPFVIEGKYRLTWIHARSGRHKHHELTVQDSMTVVISDD